MYKSIIPKILTSFQKVLFPDKCSVCGKFSEAGTVYSIEELTDHNITDAYRFVLEEVLCGDCIKSFVPVEPPYCEVCGGMFKSRAGENHKCSGCIENRKKPSKIRSVGIYEGALLELIHKFKYNSKIQLADILGKLLFIRLFELIKKDSFDIVIPVPLHPSRMRKRGFNQALLPLKSWESYLRNSDKELTIKNDILLRVKKTKTQIGLSANERKANLKDAFKLNGSLKGFKVLLIDDVLTTGSTIDACVSLCLKGGAESVSVLTLARTGPFI